MSKEIWVHKASEELRGGKDGEEGPAGAAGPPVSVMCHEMLDFPVGLPVLCSSRSTFVNVICLFPGYTREERRAGSSWSARLSGV